MRVAMCHNYYRQRGGEDQVFEDEVALLRKNGHHVVEVVRRNDEMRGLRVVGAAAGVVWNVSSARELVEVVSEEAVDVVHVHNWLPQISPSVLRAVRATDAAVVHTLHNYRWMCIKATLFRDGAICEDCIGRSVMTPGIRHRCYRDSLGQSAALAATVAVHRAAGTIDAVDRFIALTDFAAGKHTEAGFPPDRIAVKPNFVAPDPGFYDWEDGYALYMGRLTEEKGLRVLLDAWQQNPGLALKIAGTGPLETEVAERARSAAGIEYLGFVGGRAQSEVLGGASFLVVPSLWYEGFPKVVVEAFAHGTPVLASRLGSLESVVEDGVTGWLAPPGDSVALRASAQAAAGSDLGAFRKRARERYTTGYTAEHNYAQVVSIYRAALTRAAAR